ncbi:hypothetical protein BRPE64_ECDS02630 (plasmid) [Caballeronia insecticola]|uniref:Uncharacterized protein n=1 Tax=Caballeronia insecticola TaxID=758793 RepID=A0A060PRS2_9BURK|nr:hypothetical protein BRPE64_ECDS02630 [Caballeronia insecticola]
MQIGVQATLLSPSWRRVRNVVEALNELCSRAPLATVDS